MGNGAENQIRMSLPAGASPEEVGRVLRIYKPYYTAHCQVKTRPYDGVLEALEVLKAKYQSVGELLCIGNYTAYNVACFPTVNVGDWHSLNCVKGVTSHISDGVVCNFGV